MLVRLVPLLVAAAFVAFFVRLGFWQLDRAAQKAALFAGYEQTRNEPPQSLVGYQPLPRFSRVRLRGRFGEPQVLLDNQPLDGRQGAHLFAPFALAGGQTLMVNRGWLPLPRDRRILPPLPPAPPGTVELSGLLSNWPRPGITLGEIDYTGTALLRVPYLEPDRLAQWLKTALLPQILLATDGAGEGLLQRWQPQVMAPERHRGYAVQWFSLAAAVALVTLILQWRYMKND